MSESFNECSICLSNAKLPVATLCGHIFCWNCIKQWINIGKMECPICKNGLKLNELIKLYTGNNQEKKGEVDDRPQHERSQVEYVNPNFYQRVLNNFGFDGNSNNTILRPPIQREVQRNIASLVVLIIGIIFIIYIFNS